MHSGFIFGRLGPGTKHKHKSKGETGLHHPPRHFSLNSKNKEKQTQCIFMKHSGLLLALMPKGSVIWSWNLWCFKPYFTFSRCSPKAWNEKLAREAANPILSVSLAKEIVGMGRSEGKKDVSDNQEENVRNDQFLSVNWKEYQKWKVKH